VSTNERFSTSTKDFTGWHALKQSTHDGARRPTFKEREVWWCSVGVNIGHEIDGKHERFLRPVLVIRKFNRQIFWGVAMSTKLKDNQYYFPIEFKGRQECIVLSHLRLYDAKRLNNLMGTLPKDQFDIVKEALKAIL
jgi:mRNA interferase MazF